MNKKIITLAAILSLGLNSFSQTPKIKPTGYIKLGYVPERTYFQKYNNEFLSDLKLGLKTSFKEFTFEGSFENVTYSSRLKGFFFHPRNNKYIFNFEIKHKNFSLFFDHYCFHPVGERSFSFYYYTIDYTDLTDMGIKYEW